MSKVIIGAQVVRKGGVVVHSVSASGYFVGLVVPAPAVKS